VDLVAIALAKLLDPIAIILGILNGYFIRSKVVLIVLSVAIAGVVELLLAATQVTRQYNPVEIGIGFAAALAWSGLTFSIRQAKRSAAKPEKPE
jgi:hypothetical protein